MVYLVKPKIQKNLDQKSKSPPVALDTQFRFPYIQPNLINPKGRVPGALPVGIYSKSLPINDMAFCNEYLEIPCCEGPGQKIKVKDLVYIGRSAYQEIAVYDTEPYGRCLFLDGVIQSSESDHEKYDKTILKKLRPADKDLLILGGGDGHTAEMALKLNPEIRVTVVELDGDVVNACKECLDQTIFGHPNVNLVIDDAFHFMKQAGNGSYDCVICDLTDLPIGYNNIEFKDFYLNVFSLSAKILNRPGWISAYMGCNADIAIDTLSSHFSQIESCDIFIPSFGETCFFCLRTIPILLPTQPFLLK